MKELTLLALIGIFMAGCDLGDINVDRHEALTASFTLSDTIGHAANVFRSGEQFEMSFSMTNTTDDTLIYHHTFPPVIFHILKGDSIVASSIDGYLFPMVYLKAFLAPGEALQGAWIAPTTPPQNPRVVLRPGVYQASVSFSMPEQVTVNPLPPIIFSIVE